MHDIFGGIYKNKRVFITGHTGFKGSWLSFWLTKLGAKVTGYSIGIPTKPSHFDLLKLDVNSITGDVLDKKKLLRAVRDCKPDIVFHLAAQPLVRKSYTSPVETLEINIMGTVNILESCRQTQGIKAIEIITSDKCYQNREIKRGYKETDSLGGSDPYSGSKGCAELVVDVYRSSFFNVNQYSRDHLTLLASTRAGNVIGGGDWAQDRLIPDIIRAVSNGKITNIRYPNAKRPWQHVLEPLSGYLQLGSKLLKGKKFFAEGWNFGPKSTSCLKVEEVIQTAKKSWNEIRYKINENEPDWHEANVLTLDSSKARKYLKWRGVWASRVAINKAVGWYKQYYNYKKILSKDDLNQYISDAKKASLEWTN